MKLKRVRQASYSLGSTLVAKEQNSEGIAELTIDLQQDGVLFQFASKTQYIFSNGKRADGMLFQPEQDGNWSVTLIELKKQVKYKEWENIKLQWHGAWLHALAIAGALEICLSDKVQGVVGYRAEKLGTNSPDPIQSKLNIQAIKAQNEWVERKAILDEIGEISFIPVQLDENGYGQVVL